MLQPISISAVTRQQPCSGLRRNGSQVMCWRAVPIRQWERWSRNISWAAMKFICCVAARLAENELSLAADDDAQDDKCNAGNFQWCNRLVEKQAAGYHDQHKCQAHERIGMA